MLSGDRSLNVLKLCPTQNLHCRMSDLLPFVSYCQAKESGDEQLKAEPS